MEQTLNEVNRKISRGPTYSGDNLLDLLLVTLHLQNTPHLHQVDLLPVSHAHDLIESTQKFECVLQDFALVRTAAEVRYDTCEEMESVDILKDIRCLIGYQENIEIFQRLIDVSDFGGLDGGVLGVCRDEFWERCEQGFDPGPRHIAELARNDG